MKSFKLDKIVIEAYFIILINIHGKLSAKYNYSFILLIFKIFTQLDLQINTPTILI